MPKQLKSRRCGPALNPVCITPDFAGSDFGAAIRKKKTDPFFVYSEQFRHDFQQFLTIGDEKIAFSQSVNLRIHQIYHERFF
jgi:hypothetical protein